MQRQKEPAFIDFVNELRHGICSDAGRRFADTLSRRVNPEDFGVGYVSQIYATNDEVDFSNFVQLESVEGDFQTWRAVNSGDKNLLNRLILISFTE